MEYSRAQQFHTIVLQAAAAHQLTNSSNCPREALQAAKAAVETLLQVNCCLGLA